MIPETLVPGVEVYTQLLRFLIVMVVGVVITRVVLMPVAFRAARSAEKRAKHSIENLAGVTGLFLTFTVALQAAQFGNLVTVLGAVAAALTVAVGFGMRDQISNLVAGLLIQLDNPFVKGDYIEVAESEGKVQDIQLRATTLEGTSGEKLVLPNGILTGNPVQNYTKGSKVKTVLEIPVETAKAGKKSEKLKDVAGSFGEILEKPEPEVRYTGFEDEKIKLELHYWTKDSAKVPEIKSRVLEKINEKVK